MGESDQMRMAQEALLLEHVNLNIPDEKAARAFYLDCLGGVANPVSTNARQLHVNLGSSQFHLLHRFSVLENEAVEQPQIWSGEIELWTTQELLQLQQRLQQQCPTQHASLEHDELLCSCPWGNRFRIRLAPKGFSPGLPGHPGGFGELVAMPKLVHLVQPGAAAVLVKFWREVLCCSAQLEEGPLGTCCTVCFVAGQEFVFKEDADARACDAYDTEEASSYHVALYLHSDVFREAFLRADAAGLIYENVRFASGPPDNAASWEEASAVGQFRVKDMKDPSTGVTGLVLELEIRSTSHQSYPLVK